MKLKADMAMRADINEVLQQRADVNARLALIPYEGTPEIKERGGKRYLYVRKRVSGRLTSTYVDVYSEELHQLLLRNAAEARKLRKELVCGFCFAFSLVLVAADVISESVACVNLY